MSETIVFDRRKGFVALPVQVLEMELTPGAFRLLAELCRMANLEGFCWPSLKQLGERLGRSKAAVSGYVTDLRDAGLISTETQTTANGYNYRLRYCVVFWRAWRASLSGQTGGQANSSPAAKIDNPVECSVRQDERLRDSKNHIQLNHSLDDLDYSDLGKAWADCVRGAPYPALRKEPSPEVLAATRNAVRQLQTKCADISKKIGDALEQTWKCLGVSSDATAMIDAVSIVAGKNLSLADVQALCEHIKRQWQPHWRKVPSRKQLEQMIKTAGIVPQATQIKLLEGYLKRWKLAQKTLRGRTGSETVRETGFVASSPNIAPLYPRI
jgi:biotin operon repressor